MSKATILIRKGTYRNKPVDGKVFELVEQYKKTASGGHVFSPTCPILFVSKLQVLLPTNL